MERGYIWREDIYIWSVGRNERNRNEEGLYTGNTCIYIFQLISKNDNRTKTYREWLETIRGICN